MQKRESGWVLYDFGYSSSLDSDMATEGAALTAGFIYRSYLDDETIFGVNAYLEAGRRSDLEDFMGLASLGVEYEKRPEEWTGSFVQAGGNFYVLLDDYTNIDEYGELSSAPRIGIDGYASFGRSFDGYSWLGRMHLFMPVFRLTTRLVAPVMSCQQEIARLYAVKMGQPTLTALNRSFQMRRVRCLPKTDLASVLLLVCALRVLCVRGAMLASAHHLPLLNTLTNHRHFKS